MQGVSSDSPSANIPDTEVPQWQTAAGGKNTIRRASIRPSKPGTFTPPNFPLSNDDSYGPTAGLFEPIFTDGVH